MPDRPAQYTVDEFIETVEYVEGVLSRDPFDEIQRTFAAATLRDALRQMRRASGLADSPPRLRAVPPDGAAAPDGTNDPVYEAGELDLTGIDFGRLIGQASVQADIAHWTRRMLQALDGYWLHCEGLPPRKWNTVRSESTAEDWWIRFEKYRARVEFRAGGGA